MIREKISRLCLFSTFDASNLQYVTKTLSRMLFYPCPHLEQKAERRVVPIVTVCGRRVFRQDKTK
jgi:hypothetical protein